jgi:hypothetical protein
MPLALRSKIAMALRPCFFTLSKGAMGRERSTCKLGFLKELDARHYIDRLYKASG